MNINQEQLTIFKTVMETGSFSAAARKLGKVPSAVSMSIANLEIEKDKLLSMDFLNTKEVYEQASKKKQNNKKTFKTNNKKIV